MRGFFGCNPNPFVQQSANTHVGLIPVHVLAKACIDCGLQSGVRALNLTAFSHAFSVGKTGFNDCFELDVWVVCVDFTAFGMSFFLQTSQQLFSQLNCRIVLGVVHLRDRAVFALSRQVKRLLYFPVVVNSANWHRQVVDVKVFASQDFGVVGVQVGAVNDVAFQREQPVTQIQRASVCHIGVEVLLKQLLNWNRAALLTTYATTSKDVCHQGALVIGLDLLSKVTRTQVNPIWKNEAAFVVNLFAGTIT